MSTQYYCLRCRLTMTGVFVIAVLLAGARGASAQVVKVDVTVTDLKGGLLSSVVVPGNALQSQELQDVDVYAFLFTNVPPGRRNSLSIQSFGRSLANIKPTVTQNAQAQVRISTAGIAAADEAFIVLVFARHGTLIPTAISPFIAVPKDVNRNPRNGTSALEIAVPEFKGSCRPVCCGKCRRHHCRRR